MKAPGLVASLNRMGRAYGEYQEGIVCKEAAIMLERYLALADELEAEASRTRSLIRSVAMNHAAKRIREIAEGKE